jgi:mono/diheme cytochrome c family protein
MKPAALRVFLPAIVLAYFLPAAAGSRLTAYGMSSAEWQFFRSDVYAELAKAPEKAKIRPNPLENDPQAAAAGQILFAGHCAECHGDDAGGARKGPSLRASEVRSATPGTLFWILSNGVVRKKMPSWSKLPEPQRWQLVRYLKSLESE